MIHFDPKLNLTAKEKQIIGQEYSCKIKKQKTQSLIAEFRQKHPHSNKKEIAKLTGLSYATIRRNWQDTTELMKNPIYKIHKPQDTWSVYKIKVGGKTRYIGLTNNLIRREKEHNKSYKKGDTKHLYKMTSETSPETIYELLNIKDFTSKLEAERYEALLILIDWFGKRELWQTVPFGFKYF